MSTPPAAPAADPGAARIALAVAAVALVAAALAAPPLVGLYHDDGIYVGTAISLASGDGYRMPHLPGAPLQAKYPPLYPVLLAPVAAVVGRDPAALGAYRWPSVLATLAALALLPGLFRRWGLAPRSALAATALTGASPLVFQHALHAMSEAPFLLLTVGLLRLLPAAGETVGTRRWWGAAGCAAGAVLTRSVGLALLPALLGLAWGRRREPLAWLPVAAALAAAGAWHLASSAMRAAEAARGLGPLYDYYLGYGGWVQTDALTTVATHNLAGIVLAAGNACVGGRELGLPGWQGPALLGAVAIAAGAVAWGRRAPVAALYAAATLALLGVWPFPVDRFLVPLTPFAVAAAFLGASALLRRAAAPAAAGPALAAAAVAGCLAADLARFPTPSRIPMLAGTIASAPFAGAAEWVRANTPQDAVVISDHDPWVWLATGRRAIPPAVVDPLWAYGRTPEPGRLTQALAEADRLGARWILASSEWDPAMTQLWSAALIGRAPLAERRAAWPAAWPIEPGTAVFERR